MASEMWIEVPFCRSSTLLHAPIFAAHPVRRLQNGWRLHWWTGSVEITWEQKKARWFLFHQIRAVGCRTEGHQVLPRDFWPPPLL